MATFQRNLSLGPSGQSQMQLAQSLIQQGQQNSNVRTPLEAIGKTLQSIRGQQMMEDVQDQQKQRRDAYTRTMRNVATAGSEGTVTGPGGGGTGEVATAKQRMIDYLSANPDTAPTAAQMQLSQALQPEQARTQTISGEMANRMFGTSLSPGSAVTVESGPQGRRITGVQEGQSGGGMEVNSQFGAVDRDGNRMTVLRTNRGLFTQAVDDQGRSRLVPVDSRNIRPVSTQETGPSSEISGLGDTEQRKLRDLESSTENFIATTGDAINLLRDNPNINTWSARAQSTLNSMAQEIKALGLGGANLKDSEKDPLNPAQWQDEFGEMGIQSDRLKGVIQSLAFSLARSREGGRLSEADIRSALKTVGTSADPQSLSTTMQDVANRAARRFKINYENRTGKRYEGTLGLESLPNFEPPQEEQQMGPTREGAPDQGGIEVDEETRRLLEQYQ